MAPRRALHAARLSLLAPLVGALIGCQSATPPTFRVVDAAVAQRSDEGVVINFTLEGDNTNEIELPLRTVRYSLDIDGRRVFTGERSAEATLRRLGSQTFTVPAAVPLADDPLLGTREFRVSGTVGYIAPGTLAELLLDLGLSMPTVAFADAGTVDLGSGALTTPAPAAPPQEPPATPAPTPTP